jgi:CPA1 family monovalent cation:H+ antiporter
MESVEIVLAMLLAVVASGYIARVLPLPLPLVQIAMGAAIAGVLGRGIDMEPDMFFLLFLPPLLFLDGWRIPKDGLLRDKAAILELALGLVLFTVVGAGFLIHWLIPAMPLAVAFALAAIVSPTDPVAVSSITARVPVPKRVMHILEGESLLNDATGLVCFRFAVAAALTGRFSPASASLTFLWLALGGVAAGVGVTLAISAAQRWLSGHIGEQSGTPILISLLIPFGAYLMAEQINASGILAAVAAGITMSYVEMGGRALAATRLQRAAVWSTMQLALNGIVFVLLGEQLPAILRGAASLAARSGGMHAWWLAACALMISISLALLRLAWVWTSLRLTLFRARRRDQAVVQPPLRLILAMSLAGVRGTLTLAGIMTLPLLMPDGSPFPARDLAIFLATAVILLSLVTASVALPNLLRDLKLPEEPAEHLEEDNARRTAAKAAIDAVEKTRRAQVADPESADIHSQAATRVISLYRQRLGGAANASEAGQLRREDEVERSLRLAALQAERDAVFRLARRGRISDETSRRLVREIDLVESRYR